MIRQKDMVRCFFFFFNKLKNIVFIIVLFHVLHYWTNNATLSILIDDK